MNQLIFIAYLSLFSLGLADNVRGPLFPEVLQQFSVSQTQGSFFFIGSSVFGFIASLMSSFYIQRWGVLRSLMAALLLIVFSQIGMALSPHFIWLVFFSMLNGYSMGLMGVYHNVIVTASSSLGELQKAQSGLHCMYGAASFLAPLLVSFVNVFSPHWQSAFILVAFLVFTFLLFIYQFLYKKNRGSELNQCQTLPGLQSPQGSSSQLSFQSFSHRFFQKEGLVPIKNKIKTNFEKIYVSFVVGAYVLAEIMVSSRLALFVRKYFTNKNELALGARYTFLFFLLMFFGRALFFFWKPSLKLFHQIILYFSFSFFFLILGCLWHPLGFVLSGLSMAPIYPFLMTYIGNIFRKDLNSISTYVISTSAIFVIMMHFFMGAFSDLFGIEKALFLGPFFIIIALGMFYFHPLIFNLEKPS